MIDLCNCETKIQFYLHSHAIVTVCCATKYSVASADMTDKCVFVAVLCILQKSRKQPQENAIFTHL